MVSCHFFHFKIEKATHLSLLYSSTIFFQHCQVQRNWHHISIINQQNQSQSMNELKTKTTKTHTFAIRLALRYFIMRAHPAINAMPNNTPIKIPENKPIFPDSKHHLSSSNTKNTNPKTKTPTWEKKKKKKEAQIQAKNESLSEIREKNPKGSYFRGWTPIGMRFYRETKSCSQMKNPKCWFFFSSCLMLEDVGLPSTTVSEFSKLWIMQSFLVSNVTFSVVRSSSLPPQDWKQSIKAFLAEL